MFKKGDHIRHPTLEQWGVGEILENTDGNNVRAFFVGVGERTLALSAVTPIRAEANEDALAIFKHLRTQGAVAMKAYRSLAECLSRFLEEYPGGFSGERYADQERNYKIKAHEQAVVLLDRNELTTLLDQEAYPKICERANKVLQLTNLPFPNEKMAFRDGLKSDPVAQQRLSRSLVSLLHGEGALQTRFEDFASALEVFGADKWPVATCFLFLHDPTRHMFVKPTVTQFAAKVCATEINYDSRVNWRTYDSVLRFADKLRKDIGVLNPRDMIDVQSFMWCIAPHK